jgi:ketosteroid isomerase-like protein
MEFFKKFDNRLVNNPYKIAFGQGNHTCTIADWKVTMKEPMKRAEGKIAQPGKTTKLEFCTVVTWKNGEIVEERLFYDVVGMMKQLGLMK